VNRSIVRAVFGLAIALHYFACASQVTGAKRIIGTPSDLHIERQRDLEHSLFKIEKYQPAKYLAEVISEKCLLSFDWVRLSGPLKLKQEIFLGKVFLSEGPTILFVGNTQDYSVSLVKRLEDDLVICSDGSYTVFNGIVSRETIAPVDPLRFMQLSVLYLEIFFPGGQIDLASKSNAPKYSVQLDAYHLYFTTKSTSSLGPAFSFSCNWHFVFDKAGYLRKVESTNQCLE
jgi:hypothetical protein